jgi:hypothetical protein
MWKMKTIFDNPNDTSAKYYSPTAVNEIIVLFKGRSVLKQHIAKKFGIKICKLCDSKGYTCNMSVYLGKDRKHATATMTATHANVSGLTARIKNLGHKLYMDNVFSSPDLFDDLHMKAINCCGTVRPNQKGITSDFGRKLRLKQGDIKTRVKGDLTTTVWKDKRNVKMLTNMHRPPVEGNFCNEYGNAMKPATVQDYNRHMGYVDKSDHMTNSYSISRCMWKWTKKMFFHLLDLSILKFLKYLPVLKE